MRLKNYILNTTIFLAPVATFFYINSEKALFLLKKIYSGIPFFQAIRNSNFFFNLIFKRHAILAPSFFFSHDEFELIELAVESQEAANTSLFKTILSDFLSQPLVDGSLWTTFMMFSAGVFFFEHLLNNAPENAVLDEARQNLIDLTANWITGWGLAFQGATFAFVYYYTVIYLTPAEQLAIAKGLKDKLDGLLDLFFNNRNSYLLDFLNKKDNFASPHVAAQWLEKDINAPDGVFLNGIKNKIFETAAGLKKREVDGFEIIRGAERKADLSLSADSADQIIHDLASKKFNITFQINAETPFEMLKFPAGGDGCFFILGKIIDLTTIFLLFSSTITLIFVINILRRERPERKFKPRAELFNKKHVRFQKRNITLKKKI